MGVIIFNNKSSADCRIQVAHPPGYAYPERDYTITHIPGRNGDIIQDNGLSLIHISEPTRRS